MRFVLLKKIQWLEFIFERLGASINGLVYGTLIFWQVSERKGRSLSSWRKKEKEEEKEEEEGNGKKKEPRGKLFYFAN